MSQQQCEFMLKKGRRCLRSASVGSNFCGIHKDKSQSQEKSYVEITTQALKSEHVFESGALKCSQCKCEAKQTGEQCRHCVQKGGTWCFQHRDCDNPWAKQAEEDDDDEILTTTKTGVCQQCMCQAWSSGERCKHCVARSSLFPNQASDYCAQHQNCNQSAKLSQVKRQHFVWPIINAGAFPFTEQPELPALDALSRQASPKLSVLDSPRTPKAATQYKLGFLQSFFENLSTWKGESGNFSINATKGEIKQKFEKMKTYYISQWRVVEKIYIDELGKIVNAIKSADLVKKQASFTEFERKYHYADVIWISYLQQITFYLISLIEQIGNEHSEFAKERVEKCRQELKRLENIANLYIAEIELENKMKNATNLATFVKDDDAAVERRSSMRALISESTLFFDVIIPARERLDFGEMPPLEPQKIKIAQGKYAGTFLDEFFYKWTSNRDVTFDLNESDANVEKKLAVEKLKFKNYLAKDYTALESNLDKKVRAVKESLTSIDMKSKTDQFFTIYHSLDDIWITFATMLTSYLIYKVYSNPGEVGLWESKQKDLNTIASLYIEERLIERQMLAATTLDGFLALDDAAISKRKQMSEVIERSQFLKDMGLQVPPRPSLENSVL